MQELTASQEKSLRFVADKAGKEAMDIWAKDPGYNSASIHSLASKGIMELVGFETCANGSYRITDEGWAWLAEKDGITEEAPVIVSWQGETLTPVTVKGKVYLAGPLHPAGEWIDGEFVKNVRERASYWATRDGKEFGRIRNAYSDGNSGSIGRAICDAMRAPVADAAPVLAAGWREVPHAVTGAVVGWLRPGQFRNVSEGMPTA